MSDEPGDLPAETIVLRLDGALERAAVPALCERLRVLLIAGDGAGGAVICDVRGLTPNLVAVDALARLQLTALRHGWRLRLRHVSVELCALLNATGLAAVLPPESAPSGQMRRQAEEREQPRGVEEEGHAADPALG